MAEFVSIRKMREIRDPELFVRCVVNDKARLERLDEKRRQRAEEARKEAERLAQEAKQKEEFHSFLVKFSVGLCFVVTVAATLLTLTF